MSKSKKIKPSRPGGFRDYGPREMIVRNRMTETIRGVFERFGFDPLETPGMERRLVLTGGDPEFRMAIYDTRVSSARLNFDASDPDRTALRFDLTVPLARYVAANLGGDEEGAEKFRLPFRRYQIGNVWRGEKPQAGRFCEFMQFDADIVGAATPVADAEIIALMVETMRALEAPSFIVRFNNRKLLNALPAFAGYDEVAQTAVLRVLDKFLKIGRDGVLRELVKPLRPSSPDEVDVGEENTESQYGAGISQGAADRIGAFLDLTGSTNELLDGCTTLFRGIAAADTALNELRAIITALRAMDVPEQYWAFDLSIARGLGYYTGPVFETFLVDAQGAPLEWRTKDADGKEVVERFGSVFSGGRYDDLVDRFGAGTIPATGASIGIDRLFDQLVKLGRITFIPTRAQVLVTVMDQGAMAEYLTMAGELRRAGLRTMLWVGEDPAFRAQVAYATGQEIPVVVIVGGNELAAGTVTVKDMAQRKQETVPRSALLTTVQRILNQNA